MDGIADSDVAIEVSTAGLRKPVGEIYPARGVPRDVPGGGRPVALSSDAHMPEHARLPLRRRASSGSTQLGVTELAVFERRERRLEPIG